jgi:hypothetical protein
MSVTNLNEVDNLLNEREISLKKKIFKLGKMETLVFSDPKLTNLYNDMAINGEERYGYHYNETIMNIIFNDYILNSPKFLQKYKMARPKEKKRRDKSGINKLKNDAIEKVADKAGKTATELDEETNSSSSGAYAGPSAWAANGDLLGNSSKSPIRKPIFPQGTVIQENYLAEADYFAKVYDQLNEEQDFSMYDKLNKDYKASHTGSNHGIGVSELPASKKTNEKIKNIDDNSPLYVGQDIARMRPKDVDLLHNDMTQPHSYFPHPENKNLPEDGISGVKNEQLDREAELSDISDKSDAYGNETKNMSNSDLNVIDNQMKSHKFDTANIETESVAPMGKKLSTREDVKALGRKLTKEDIPNLTGEALYSVAMTLANKMLPISWDDLSDVNSMYDYLKPNGGMTFDSLMKAVKRAVNKRLAADGYNLRDLEESIMDEKAVSKAQQRFMGMVRAVQTGEIEPSKVGSSVEKAASSMKPNDVKDFASTKTNKLPEKVKENNMKNIEETSMIDDNPASMSVKAGSGGGMDTGMSSGGEMDDTMNSSGMSEGDMSEGGIIKADPRVQKLVNIVNALINMAKDSDGDPIGVVDSQSTWQEPYIYEPIEYRNGQLKITSHSVYNSKPEVEVILKRNMEYDGIPTLRTLATQYRKAIKNHPRDQQRQMDRDNREDNMEENKIFSELNEELKQLSDLQSNLKSISEDKRTPSLINVDRLGNDNSKNFKQDMQHSGTKEIIDVEKELQWKDQQTEIKDPKKLSSDIEKEELKKTKGVALKNVGNSANESGDEVPKRNLSTEEQDEVDSYRLGLGDYDYSIKPDQKFEDRMKKDMGDKNYAMRLRKLDMRHNQPMYNKDTQPTANAKKVNESYISGKFFDEFGKSHIIDFTLSEAKEMTKIDEAWFPLNLNGLGNAYTNKLDTTTHKIGINEGISEIISLFEYYVDANKNIFTVEKSKKMLSENTVGKEVVNGDFDKMKHLFEYKASDFVNVKNNTRI